MRMTTFVTETKLALSVKFGSVEKGNRGAKSTAETRKTRKINETEGQNQHARIIERTQKQRRFPSKGCETALLYVPVIERYFRATFLHVPHTS